MFPLRDDNRSGSAPVVTVTLIALNVVVFGYEVLIGSQLREFMMHWALIPARVTAALDGRADPTGAGLTFLSSMFLHGGWLHLAGNVWYLWIFGDNVEDLLGHSRFVAFYLLGGIVASALHVALGPSSPVPTVGASGAIAAVLGAYARRFPHARVTTLIPLFPVFQVVALPALAVLGLWFVFQFFNGALALAWSTRGGGVAWTAHIAGFLFGLLALRLFEPRRAAPG